MARQMTPRSSLPCEVKLTFLSFKLTLLSFKLTFLSFKLTFLSLKLTFLRRRIGRCGAGGHERIEHQGRGADGMLRRVCCAAGDPMWLLMQFVWAFTVDIQ